MKKIFVMIVAAMMVLGFSSLYLVSCSSHGSSGTGSSPGFSKGVITAKGSIFVNEVEYKTSGSSISMDSTTNHAESELQVGMVVKVKGSMSDDGVNGEGAEIEYEDNLEGPLTAVSGTALPATLTVMDQAVLVDVNTHMSPTGTTVSTLATAVATTTPIVEVSGMTDNTGVIHATFIELKKSSPTAGDPIEIKGTIATGSTNTTAKTLQIGALNVDYSLAQLKDFPTGGIADGQFVEVKSTFGQYTAGAHTLVATNVEYKVEMSPAENDKTEVEGFVANYNVAAKTFTVSGIAVNASGVASLPAIANGSIVEVEGTYSGGTLTATKVVLKSSL